MGGQGPPLVTLTTRQRVGARLDPSKLALSRPGEATISPWWPLSPFTPSIYSLVRKNLYVLLPLNILERLIGENPKTFVAVNL